MNECIHCGELLAVGATRCARCERRLTPEGTNRVVYGGLLVAFFVLPLLTAPFLMRQQGLTPGAIAVLAVGLGGMVAGVAMIQSGRARMAAWERDARAARAVREAAVANPRGRPRGASPGLAA